MLTLAVALILDRLIGDPPWLWSRVPHPVAWIGFLIARLEAAWNSPNLPPARRRRNGVLALLALVLVPGALGMTLDHLISHGAWGVAFEAVIASVLLAQKSLIDHVRFVAQQLQIKGLEEGQEAVSRIVGRDVTLLDEAGVSRAAIESAAESFSDGVVAPALWFAVLGLPGLFIYKAVNTADSMIGHRSPRHEAFGWASARFDDLLNWVPARLSALLIIAAAALSAGRGAAAIRSARRDAGLHKSPNAGWPEAAAAGALGIALGGPRRYGDLEVDGAWFNAGGRREAGPHDVRAAMRLIDIGWAILLAMVAVIALWLGR